MQTKNREAKILALQIYGEGRIEAVLRKHTALISWSHEGVSPVIATVDNGTCCFVDTGHAKFVVTCAHVWNGFVKDAETSRVDLWISLIASDDPSVPSFPLRLRNPRLISEDLRRDLATITFDDIDSLESWRFAPLRDGRNRRVNRGERVFFIGFPGDEVRLAQTDWLLRYTLVTNEVTDVSYGRFLLHNEPGTGRLTDQYGQSIPPKRWPGISGAPVFRVKTLLSPDPVLVGFVSQLSSCGLSSPTTGAVGATTAPRHETSDGDIWVSHVDFVRQDGAIQQ